MAHRWVDVHGLLLHCVEAGTGPWWCSCTASRGSGTPGATKSRRLPTPVIGWSCPTCPATTPPSSRPGCVTAGPGVGSRGGRPTRNRRPVSGLRPTRRSSLMQSGPRRAPQQADAVAEQVQCELDKDLVDKTVRESQPGNGGAEQHDVLSLPGPPQRQSATPSSIPRTRTSSPGHPAGARGRCVSTEDWPGPRPTVGAWHC